MLQYKHGSMAPPKQRYVDAPASYQEITSPGSMLNINRLSGYWRGGCCSHGVNVYRWKGKTIELIVAVATFQPVISRQNV